jgi:hypothetical protein
MENILINIVIVITTLFSASVIHELGHAFLLNKYTKIKVKLNFKKYSWYSYKLEVGEESDYEGLNKKQLFNIYMAGIGAGLIPILMLNSYEPQLALISICFYVAFSVDDLINIWRYCK